MASQFDDVESGENGPVEDEFPQWYILKCQVNREDRVKRELERRIQLSGLSDDVEEVYVPFERVKEFGPNGRQREVKHKVFPGYILVKMKLNKDTWFLMRETNGVGDFAGSSGRPMPAPPEDVERLLRFREGEKAEKPRVESPYAVGDIVRIVSGSFAETEGEVASVDVNAGLVTVNVKMFGKDTPVQMAYWQVERVNGNS